MIKTILITGANRGLGLAFTKKLAEDGNSIIATCRKPEAADELNQLAKQNDRIRVERLDIAEQGQISVLAESLKEQPIDWLINNAGIYGDRAQQALGSIDREQFFHVMNVNCLGALKLSEALLPNLKLGNEKFILTITSAMGSIADSSGGKYIYRAGKCALNCVMRVLALDVKDQGINVMLIHPGWVETDMGGPNSLITAETSINGILQQIAEHKDQSHAEVMRRFDGGTMLW